MRTSIPGKSNKGFTLIELVVVVSLITLLLAFSLPRFGVTPLADDSRKVSRWIVVKTRHLKSRSFRERKPYILHIGVDTGKFWTTREGMTEEERLKAENSAYTLPEGFRVLDVEYPDAEKTRSGKAEIYFTENGVSSKAFIHIEDHRRQRKSFLVEPFLPHTKVFETYEEFNG